jgi:hypothetical protein
MPLRQRNVRIAWQQERARLHAAHRQCSLCRKHGASWISDAALCEIDRMLRGVFNIRAMTDHIFSTLETEMDFDEEDVEGRLARRKKNWTGKVIVVADV